MASIIINIIIILLVAFLIFYFFWTFRSSKGKGYDLRELSPVQNFTLENYLGKWYEIYRIENRFEKGLEWVTADYRLLSSGFIEVINSGKTGDGNTQIVKGRARITSQSGVLRVSFFPFIESPYVVLYFDGSISVVGSPDRKFLWLLSRSKVVSKYQESILHEIAADNGYSLEAVSSLHKVIQN